ncbi:MAG: pyrroloquinoline quinone precursor peptide PqqA [Acidobacteria bacterium]|nr:pyrroloquinoline quinone precursor peptide PqqA [Acidobacteriota bacterium]MYH27584.1 pyrroloquinoline quinone precursor peptide PqqA [Acidobacteriota bacterium]
MVCSAFRSSRRFLRNYQGVAKMTWTKPEFKAISLSMEVTFYVNSR